jgi:hypothetical protein
MPSLVVDMAPRTVSFTTGSQYGFTKDTYVPAKKHLYLRYIVAFPSTWDFGPWPGGFKMPGIGERRAGGVVPNGCERTESGWSGRLQADCHGKTAVLCGYGYWAVASKPGATHTVEQTWGGTSPCGTILRPKTGGTLTAGRWHGIEVEVIRNTPCNADGLYRVRLDDVTIFEDTAARFTDCPMAESAAINLFYFGGANKSPKDQSLTVRDFLLKGA